MNDIKLEHPGKGKDGKPRYTIGGIGKVYINGHLVEGVLEFKENVLARNDIASVTLTLAVSKFTYGPAEDEYRTVQAVGDDYEHRIKLRD